MTRNAAGHVGLSREFLARSKQYLENGDLHQASEKGWGAAVHIIKAVAAVQGWEYNHHDQFDMMVQNIRHRFRQPSMQLYGDAAQQLHRNYYQHPSLLNAELVRERVSHVEQMADALEPFASNI